MRVDPLPTINGDRIRLRAPTDGDAEQRARLGVWPEINRSFGGTATEHRTLPVEEVRKQLEWVPPNGVRWVIAAVDDDRFLGTARLDGIDEANRSANFAIGIFDPTVLGQGLGTEATRLIVRYGFQELGLHRISLTVLADNKRAIAAYRKCGFEVEGRLRHTLLRDGEWLDDLVMAVLEPGSTADGERG